MRTGAMLSQEAKSPSPESELRITSTPLLSVIARIPFACVPAVEDMILRDVVSAHEHSFLALRANSHVNSSTEMLRYLYCCLTCATSACVNIGP